MAVLPVLASVGPIIELAKNIMRVGNSAVEMGNKVVDKYNDYKRDETMSLTEFTKQTTIRSRVYIDDSLIDEDVIPDLVRSLHTMYASLILNALHMTQFVTQGKTVRDLLGTVATESLEAYQDVKCDIADLTAALEAAGDRNPYRPGKLDEKYDPYRPGTNDKLGKGPPGNTKTTAPGVPPTPVEKKNPSLSTSEVNVTPTSLVPVGKTLEVEFTNPDNPSASGKLFLTVLMVPYLIPSGLASMFINKDTTLSFRNRYTMWKAGEISFWRDLIFEVDRVNQAHAIAKKDPNKVFYEFMANVAKKDRAAVTKNLMQPNANKTHNLANSVMIFSTEAVAKAKAESGIDLHDKGVRERYFKDTYAMMIAVVDTMFHQVTLYLNGIDDVGVYMFSQFEAKSGDRNGGLDLLKVLSQFTAGKAPRY